MQHRKRDVAEDSAKDEDEDDDSKSRDEDQGCNLILIAILCLLAIICVVGIKLYSDSRQDSSLLWSEEVDPKSHRPYWFNRGTGESTWIKPEALERAQPAPLPSSWKEHVDEKSGERYWFNHDTGESSWTKPGAAVPRTTGAEHVPEQPVTQAATAAVASSTEWQQHVDEKSGDKYWFNHKTGESSWTEPGKIHTSLRV